MKLNIGKMTLYSAFCVLALLTSSCGGEKNDEPQTPGETGNQPSTETTASADVKKWTTNATRYYSLTEGSIAFDSVSAPASTTIKLQPDVTYQEIDGFGAAITGSTAYNLMRMAQPVRTEFLKRTFSPTEGYGMSYIRVPIGCSDFSLSEYTLCDKPGIENFALTNEETSYIIPVLKEILSINPQIKILSSPWTAPRWMKLFESWENKNTDASKWTGGYLNPEYYDAYAEYFVKFIQAMKDNGITIHAVTMQNEPLNRGNSASMYMGWEQQRDFVKVLGPKMKAAGLDTKIYAFDHNYNYDDIADQKSYPVKIYGDSEASQWLAGAAYHNYGGNVNELNTVHNAAPDKELIFTESTAGDWNDGSNLYTRLNDDMEQICLGTVNRWSRGAIIWNLMLDSRRGPNRPGGCTTGFGAVDIEPDYKTIRLNSFYYIMAHMSAGVKPGAKRIGTSGYSKSGLTYSAFVNPDNSYALVLSNSSTADIKLNVDDTTHHFPVTIPAKGIVTVLW